MIAYVSEETPETTRAADAAASDPELLLVGATRFVRTAGHASGSKYSTVAWRALAALERDGAERVSAIAERHRVSQPSATSLINRLESEGWVHRTPDPVDGRASLVGITDAGREALAQQRAAVTARFQPLVEQLSDADRAVLARAATLLNDLGEQLERG